MKLASVKVNKEGRRVYTLGPIAQLRPFDRLCWSVLYKRWKWQWVYRWLWKKYLKECAK